MAGNERFLIGRGTKDLCWVEFFFWSSNLGNFLSTKTGMDFFSIGAGWEYFFFSSN